MVILKYMADDQNKGQSTGGNKPADSKPHDSKGSAGSGNDPRNAGAEMFKGLNRNSSTRKS